MTAIFSSDFRDGPVVLSLPDGVTWAMLEAQAAVERGLVRDRLKEPPEDTPFSFYWLERFGETPRS